MGVQGLCLKPGDGWWPRGMVLGLGMDGGYGGRVKDLQMGGARGMG